MKKLYVYILKCSDDSYYVGMTNDLNRRITEHNEGSDTACYTYYRRPVTLVFSKDYSDFSQAIIMEKRLKGWSRKKKEALINGNFNLLKQLAKCRNKTSYELNNMADKG